MSGRHARRRAEEDDVDDVEMEDDPTAQDDEEDETSVSQDLTAQLVKKLVRYAMACEYARQPIRRDAIREKVLGSHARLFRRVFAGAQKQLIMTFGMEMREWPTKDKATLTATQRRKAIAKSQGTQVQAATNSYILVSMLPEKYRSPAILPPPKIQSQAGEASYMGIVTMIIALITLSGGELSEPRLRRHLTRLNINDMMPSLVPSDRNAPVEKTEIGLQRMIRQGYLVKVVDKNVEEGETVTWFVGPRGKTEVDNEAIASMLRIVYGGSSDVFEKKLQLSLGVKEMKPAVQDADGDEAMEDASDSDGGGPSKRRRTDGEDEDGEDDEDGEEEEQPPPTQRRQPTRRRREVVEEAEVDMDDASHVPERRSRRR